MSEREVPNWFIHEWMADAGVIQAELMRRTGWSRRKASNLVTGGKRTQAFDRYTLAEAAAAFEAEPWELLMHPEDARQIRQIRESITQWARAADKRQAYHAPDRDAAARRPG